MHFWNLFFVFFSSWLAATNTQSYIITLEVESQTHFTNPEDVDVRPGLKERNYKIKQGQAGCFFSIFEEGKSWDHWGQLLGSAWPKNVFHDFYLSTRKRPVMMKLAAGLPGVGIVTQLESRVEGGLD